MTRTVPSYNSCTAPVIVRVRDTPINSAIASAIRNRIATTKKKTSGSSHWRSPPSVTARCAGQPRAESAYSAIPSRVFIGSVPSIVARIGAPHQI